MTNPGVVPLAPGIIGLSRLALHLAVGTVPLIGVERWLLEWLLNALALTIERLYRLRYLHRGSHRRLSAVELCRLLWLNLARPLAPNTS
jgi:hypothetical protein